MHEAAATRTRSVRAVEISVADPRPLVLLARLRREAADDRGALDALDRALAIDQGDGGLLASRGRVLLDLGRPDEAGEALREAADALPDDGLVHYDLGVALQRVGALQASATALSRASELRPDDPTPLRALALVHEERGDRAAAVDAMQRYLGLGGAERSEGRRFIERMTETP